MAARIESIEKSKEGTPGTLPLDTVLGHCTSVKALVEESLRDLSTINEFLTDHCADADRHTAGNTALENTARAEIRLREASQVLAAASRALAREIKGRQMLDHQFAAVQEQEATGRHRMLHDALTGMPNRILFHDRLEQGLAQSLRHGRPLAVMFIDLDGFKDVNDQYGHDMGDAVLQVLANRLQEHTRSEDTVCRYGGDEFLYLLTDPGDQRAVVGIVERVIRLIQEPCLVSLDGTEISLSLGASIGISMAPQDGVTGDKLVKSADAAMYHAKQRQTGYSFAGQGREPTP